MPDATSMTPAQHKATSFVANAARYLEWLATTANVVQAHRMQVCWKFVEEMEALPAPASTKEMKEASEMRESVAQQLANNINADKTHVLQLMQLGPMPHLCLLYLVVANRAAEDVQTRGVAVAATNVRPPPPRPFLLLSYVHAWC